MGPEKNNQYWRLRKDLSETGKKLTPEQIIEKAQEYINFCVNTPLKSMDYRGKDPVPVYIDKMRAMCLEGLCNFLGISKSTWDNWRDDEMYLEVITRVENLMFQYNFEGASANMLNANIIARKLGLTDKKEIEQTGAPIIKVIDVSPGYKDEE